jgi:ABC-type ATPase involved in cell division
MALFVEMNRLGKTILLASHDVPMIERYKLPITTLKDGTVDDGMGRAA